MKEHSNKDFKGNGYAQCTEFASSMSNLLSIFGIDIVYIQDTYHAYNIIALQNEFNTEIYDYYVVDTTIRIACYDIDTPYYTEEAYIEKIEDFDENSFVEFLRGNKTIKVPRYYMMNDGNNYLRFYNSNYDEYGIQRDYYFKIDGKYLVLTLKK